MGDTCALFQTAILIYGGETVHSEMDCSVALNLDLHLVSA